MFVQCTTGFLQKGFCHLLCNTETRNLLYRYLELFLYSCLNYLYLSRAHPVRNKTLVSYKTVVSYTAAFKDAPRLLVLLQGRAGADGARGMPGETGTKVTSLWCHSFYEQYQNKTSLLAADFVTCLAF